MAVAHLMLYLHYLYLCPLHLICICIYVCCTSFVVFAFVPILVTRRTRSGKEVAEVVVRHLEVDHKEVIRLQSGRHFDILRKLIRLPSRMLLLNVDFGETDIGSGSGRPYNVHSLVNRHIA